MSLDVCLIANRPTEVWGGNITHNLVRMATEAGIYRHLWCPSELGITHATELIGNLEKGLALLRSDPARFEQFSPENGWGTYEDLVNFVSHYLEYCKKYPDAEIEVSR